MAELKLGAHQDATVAGDHIRVATTRQDSAIITVELPIVAGGKYRVAWNSNANMWDATLTH